MKEFNSSKSIFQNGTYLLLCVLLVILVECAFWISGCTMNESINHRSDLQGPLETGPISVMLKNKSVYTLNNYQLLDSSMIGSGQFVENGNEILFKGEINFRDIEYVQVRRTAYGRTVLSIAAITAFGILASESLSGNDSFVIKDVTKVVYYSSGSGDGSCPFVYAWNGSKYVLEGEGFGTSWGRALENSTGIILPHLREKNGEYHIRIGNERPESHYVNNINIFAVSSDLNASVCVDPNNTFWPIYQPDEPISAVDLNGENILPSVRSADDQFWGANDDRSLLKSNYRDDLELKFHRPAGVMEGTIIVRSINTRLFTAVLETMSGVIGNDALHFVDAVEHDPEMISILRQWLRKSSLTISQRNGNSWEEIGSILPEASEIPFTKVIRFRVSETAGDTLHLKLSTLHDVWKFDEVSIDWTPVNPLKKISLPISRALTDEKENVLQTVASRDSNYVQLLPSQSIDCSFLPVPAVSGQKITYAVELGGYLYEWFPTVEKDKEISAQGLLNSQSRLLVMKEFLNNPMLVLPVIYARWESMREEGTVKQ